MKVSEAAKKLGVSERFIRRGLQQGRFPWGYAVKGSGEKWVYCILTEKFKEEEEKC